MSTIATHTTNAMSPVGCFGGTFNPPHRGHFELAHAACSELNLSQLLLIPAGQPWQKPQVLPATQRLEMLQLAVEDDKNERFQHDKPYVLTIDPLEINQLQASYTIDTLRKLRARWPDTPLVWVMGSDQLTNLTTWHNWDQLLDVTHLAIAQRAGSEVSTAQLPSPLAQLYADKVSLDHSWRHRTHGAFIPFHMTPIAVSSSQIRAAIATHEPALEIAALTPAVANYITNHHLYI